MKLGFLRKFLSKKTWVNQEIQDNPWDALRQGSSLSLGVKFPQKGGRLVVVHAITEQGLVPGAACIYRSDGKNSDYHADMNGANF